MNSTTLRQGLRLFRLLTWMSLTGVPSASAGVPEPDTVFFGSIALDGQFITAGNTNVSVELRATATGPALRTYRMGTSTRAGNLYVLRASTESAPPLLEPESLALGSTLHLVVRDASGVRDSKSHVLSQRGSFVRIDFGDVDSDGDGLSDSFERTHFGSATGGNPTLDQDNDGRPNLREFLQGTHPLVADGRHPADLQPANDAISIAEVTAYTLAWQLGEEWSIEPKTIPVEYVTRAGALWKGGETYLFRNTPATNAPMWWVNAPPPGPALQSTVDEAPDATNSLASTDSPSRSHTAALQGTTDPLQALLVPVSDPATDFAPASESAPAPGLAQVARSAPVNFKPAQPTAVRIHVVPESGTLSFAVEETPPTGWIVRNVSHGGRIDRTRGRIKWGPFYDTEPRDLTYEVTPLPGTSATGVFAGVGSFNGRNLTLAGISKVLPPGVASAPELASARAENGNYRFQLTGTAGNRYVIEASTDLQKWSALQTLVADGNGNVDYAVSQLGLDHRFFRARLAE